MPPFELKLKPTDRCPCGSGKRLKDCCLPTNFRPEACQTRPKSPQTGMSYPTCYARSLEDCGGKRTTGEHFISRNILELLGTLGSDPNAPFYGMIKPHGLPWTPEGEEKYIAPSSLESKVLCERHNSGLSCLDSFAKRFFLSLVSAYDDLAAPGGKHAYRVFLFNGHDLERLMLKMLSGFVASKNASTKTERIVDWVPPEPWMRILYGLEEFPHGWGLYLKKQIGLSYASKREIRIAPVSRKAPGSEKHVVYGIIVGFHGLEFLLAMESPAPGPDGTMGDLVQETTYRPLGFVLKRDQLERSFIFGWDVPGDGGVVTMEVGEPGV